MRNSWGIRGEFLGNFNEDFFEDFCEDLCEDFSGKNWRRTLKIKIATFLALSTWSFLVDRNSSASKARLHSASEARILGDDGPNDETALKSESK